MYLLKLVAPLNLQKHFILDGKYAKIIQQNNKSTNNIYIMAKELQLLKTIKQEHRKHKTNSIMKNKWQLDYISKITEMWSTSI